MFQIYNLTQEMKTGKLEMQKDCNAYCSIEKAREGREIPLRGRTVSGDFFHRKDGLLAQMFKKAASNQIIMVHQAYKCSGCTILSY
jgi:hypothetical protein